LLVEDIKLNVFLISFFHNQIIFRLWQNYPAILFGTRIFNILFTIFLMSAMEKRSFILNITTIFLLLLISCHTANNQFEKLWFYTFHSSTTANTDTTLTPASFIDIRKDGTYTSDFGTFDYGKWVLKDQQLRLINYKNVTSVINVAYFSGNEMQLGPSNGPLDNFESQPSLFASESQNPFSKENNLWRIQADKKETDTAIRDRLLNHFKFWEMYFTWAFENNIQYIDVRSTPTLIKIYGNGFGLKPTEQLPLAWKSYFFDEEDCKKANEKLKTLFDTNAVAWPHTENKYKMFISAFQQLQQKLK
jgi:hypothetical protein